MIQDNNQTIVSNIKEAYSIFLNSQGGFLPPLTPLKKVPTSYQKYLDACKLLPTYLKDQSRGCKDWLDNEFSEFDTQLLDQIDNMSMMEKSTCATLFSVLAHGYRWNTIPSPSKEFNLDHLDLPRGLALPWKHVSEALGTPMVGTLWSLLLNNWEIVGKGGGETYSNSELTYENMNVLHNFHNHPQDEQLKAFVLALVLTEARGAVIIKTLIDIIDSVVRGNEDEIIEIFETLIPALKAMNHVFMSLIKKKILDPTTWLDNIQRPYVWGVKDENGYRLEGPSGMQLGVMTCINTALDIRSDSSLANSIKKSRIYLPTGHREFLRVFDSSRPIIRDYVTKSNNAVLRGLYNEALSTMALWKQMHHRRGKMYFKGDPKSKGMETSTGLVVDEGENLLTHFEKTMEERIIETEQTKIIVDTSDYNEAELEYLDDVKEYLNDNNIISSDERRLLNRRRKQLGIEQERALQIEESSKIKSSFLPRELEYIAEFELLQSSVEGIEGENRERLRELALELKIKSERVAVLEAHISNVTSLSGFSDAELSYLEEVKFCVGNDGLIKLDERRHLIRTRKRLGLSEERTHELEHHYFSSI